MKLKIKLLFILFLLSCTQKDPAEIVYKGDALVKKNNNIPNIGYSDVYIESPDGKLVRSLRGNYNNTSNSNPNIINEKALEEEAKNNKKGNTIYVNSDGTYNTNSKNVKEYYYDENDKGYHKVVDGENLWTISKLYDMKVVELAELNNIKRPYIIKAGDRLKVINGKNKSINEDNYKQTKPTIYIVKSGETLSGIADKYGMNSKELADNNNLKYPYTLYVGQKLKLNKNDISENIKMDDEVHIVKSGDTLSSISIKYNIKQSALIDYNNLKQPYNLYVGQKIKLNNSSGSNNDNDTKIAKTQEKEVKQVKNENSITAKPSTLKIENKENSFIWPIQGKIVSLFGSKTNGLYNDGINIAANKGDEFKSTEDGIVAYVGNELRGYGTIILIKHSNNWISAYAHCESVSVSKGDKVSKGQVIGTVGETGSVSSPQLYFSLRKGRNAVDPQKYLK